MSNFRSTIFQYPHFEIKLWLFTLENFISTWNSFNFIYQHLNAMSVEISFTNTKPFCFIWLLCTFISENNRATGNLISTRNDFSKLNIESFVEFLPNCYICLLGKRISKKVVIYSCQTASFVPETILFPCSSLFERN